MYITYLEVLINLITFQLEVMDLLLIEKLLTEEIVEFFVISGLEIVTNTTWLNLLTWRLKFEFSHLGNHVPLINKILKVRNNFLSLISAFLQKEMQI